MNRRTFFQGIAAGLVAVAAWPIFEGGFDSRLSEVVFDPRKKYGHWVILSEDWESIGSNVREKVMQILMIDARRTLPSGTEFAVFVKSPSTKMGTTDPFDEIVTVAWQYPVPPRLFRRGSTAFITDSFFGKRVIA